MNHNDGVALLGGAVGFPECYDMGYHIIVSRRRNIPYGVVAVIPILQHER